MNNTLSVLCSTQLDDNGEKHRVMVVDTDEKAAKAIGQSLANYGLEPVFVSNPKVVVEQIKASSPAAVLIEPMLPDVDGFDLCMTIKQTRGIRNVPVIFLTDELRPELMLCAFEAGASDYIRKGCESMELIARVRTHLDMAQLQQRLAKNQGELAKQLKAVNELMSSERDLRGQLEAQQAQMLQTEKMASIGQLAAGVAHEINNPTGFVASNLSSLAGYVTDLKTALEAYGALAASCSDQDAVAEQLACVQAVVKKIDLEYLLEDIDDLIDESIEGTHRIRQIVADMRDFSHVDSPDLAVEDLNQLLDKTLNVAHNELKYKAEVVRDFGEIPDVFCYGGKMGQVFLNLFVNAAHAMKESGKLTVRTGSEAKGSVWVEVEDNGSGIDQENLNHIFEPFFTTKEIGKGTGLGLHLAYQTVQAHEGEISVKSVVGEGTTFRIELPVKGPSESSEEQPSKSKESGHDLAA